MPRKTSEPKAPDEMTEEELAQFYQSHKGDVSLWQKEPLELPGRRGNGPTTSFAVRFTPDELDELQAAAREQGTTLSGFIRSTSLAVARARESDQRQELTELRDEAERIAKALDRMIKTAS